MLSVMSLSHAYRGQPETSTLNNISFQVKNGEFVALVGPSGCGKTTLLKCIAGLLSPTQGEIFLENERIARPNKHIGMVFQDFSLFPWLTVESNIGFGLSFTALPPEEKKRRIDRYLAITGLRKFSGSYPKVLSGGMKQRVAIARTLAASPRVILMDEPFGSLDALTRSSMQEFLLALWEKEHRTILFVTHDIEEALFLADRIIVLSSRPAAILKEIVIPFKRPRSHHIKHSKELFILRTKIAKLLGY